MAGPANRQRRPRKASQNNCNFGQQRLQKIPFALSVAPKARSRRAKSLMTNMFRLRFATLNTNGFLF
jgi:hypothetical protein